MNRLTDPGAIEARLLELAHTTDAKLTAPALAFFAPCSLDDAQRVLDELTTRDRVSMNVEDDGSISYELPGRQKLPLPTASDALAGDHDIADGVPREIYPGKIHPREIHPRELRERSPLVHLRAVDVPPRPGMGLRVIERDRGPSPALAAILTAFVPGAGHLYTGRVVAALLWFMAVGLGYALIIPGLVLHLFAMASAAMSAAVSRQLEAPRTLYLTPGRGW